MLGSLAKGSLRGAFRTRFTSPIHRRRTVLVRSDGMVTDDEGRGSNVGKFCTIDGAGKIVAEQSLAEKEASFLEVLALRTVLLPFAVPRDVLLR